MTTKQGKEKKGLTGFEKIGDNRRCTQKKETISIASNNGSMECRRRGEKR